MKKKTRSKNVKKMSRQCDWEQDAKCYVLCEFIKTWDDNKKSWYIRPCDMDADELRALWKSTKSFNITFGGSILHANDDESEEEFILRAVISGFGPDFKDINDADCNSIDFIDLSSGESLERLREAACKEAKTQKHQKTKKHKASA